MATFREILAGLTPTHYWRLDETGGTNANDEIGTSDGTYQNSPTLGATGLIAEGTAVTFARASSQAVTVPDHADWDGWSSGSLLAVIKLASLPASGEFYTLMSHTTAAGQSDDEWAWDVRNAAGTRQLAWDVNYGSGVDTNVVTWVPSTDTRYLVAMTWDGSVVKFYVNDAQQGTDQASVGTMGTVATVQLCIAAFGNQNTDQFNGTMDEVALWKNTVLALTDIQNLYGALDTSPGPGPTPPDLFVTQSNLRWA